jgi:hypothetical protein
MRWNASSTVLRYLSTIVSDLRAPSLDAGEASQRFRQAKHGGMTGVGRFDVLDGEGEFAFGAAVGDALFGAAIGENTRR